MSCHVLTMDLPPVRQRLVSPDMLPSHVNFLASKVPGGVSSGMVGILRENVPITVPSLDAVP